MDKLAEALTSSCEDLLTGYEPPPIDARSVRALDGLDIERRPEINRSSDGFRFTFVYWESIFDAFRTRPHITRSLHYRYLSIQLLVAFVTGLLPWAKWPVKLLQELGALPAPGS